MAMNLCCHEEDAHKRRQCAVMSVLPLLRLSPPDAEQIGKVILGPAVSTIALHRSLVLSSTEWNFRLKLKHHWLHSLLMAWHTTN
jgi:hypothetical protein